MKKIHRQTMEEFKGITKDRKVVLWGFEVDDVQTLVGQSDNLDCIIDSDSEHWGMKCESLEIYPPEHLYAWTEEE